MEPIIPSTDDATAFQRWLDSGFGGTYLLPAVSQLSLFRPSVRPSTHYDDHCSAQCGGNTIQLITH